MSRMTKVPTTKPLLGHNTKSKLDSLPHLINLFDESVHESAEENLNSPNRVEIHTDICWFFYQSF